MSRNQELLSRFLPRRDATREEVIHKLEHRHRKRQTAIESHTRIAEEETGLNSGYSYKVKLIKLLKK